MSVDYLQCDGMSFHCQRTRGATGFRFLGRTYRRGNVVLAAIDLVGRLASLRVAAEAQCEEYRRTLAAAALTKKLDCGMVVQYNDGKFTLTYESSSIEDIERCAQRLALELAFEWDALLATKLDTNVRFTSEGGFSLN